MFFVVGREKIDCIMKEPAICENHLFCKVYAKGKKNVQRHVIMYVLRDRHAALLARAHPQKKQVNRIGFTVTKKIGNAVERNRVKRIVRAGYRACAASMELKTGYLIVIVARPSALSVKSTEIEKELYSAFCELGMKQ